MRQQQTRAIIITISVRFERIISSIRIRISLRSLRALSISLGNSIVGIFYFNLTRLHPAPRPSVLDSGRSDDELPRPQLREQDVHGAGLESALRARVRQQLPNE
ncbi:hypothetical protein COL5a_007356 [Colletotrichum fioriniae]|nr:hypothetical protein COL5a_007356 [Colletotrichum fioriniae]